MPNHHPPNSTIILYVEIILSHITIMSSFVPYNQCLPPPIVFNKGTLKPHPKRSKWYNKQTDNEIWALSWCLAQAAEKLHDEVEWYHSDMWGIFHKQLDARKVQLIDFAEELLRILRRTQSREVQTDPPHTHSQSTQTDSPPDPKPTRTLAVQATPPPSPVHTKPKNRPKRKPTKHATIPNPSPPKPAHISTSNLSPPPLPKPVSPFGYKAGDILRERFSRLHAEQCRYHNRDIPIGCSVQVTGSLSEANRHYDEYLKFMESMRPPPEYSLIPPPPTPPPPDNPQL
jgi:hypothetical protein